MGPRAPAHLLLKVLRYREVFRRLRRVETLVDIGCGVTCDLLIKALEAKKATHAIGIDKVDFVINERPKGLQTIKSFLQDKIPLEDGIADTVTIVACLEHLDMPEEILRECYRILRPGGMIIVTTTSASAKSILEFTARIGVTDRAQVFDHKGYFTRGSLCTVFEAAGFTQISVRTFEFGCNLLGTAMKPHGTSRGSVCSWTQSK